MRHKDKGRREARGERLEAVEYLALDFLSRLSPLASRLFSL